MKEKAERAILCFFFFFVKKETFVFISHERVQKPVTSI